MNRFGEAVTNVYAAPEHPKYHCYFIKAKKNGFAECADQKGAFFALASSVTYSGHLNQKEAVLINKNKPKLFPC